MTCLTRTTSPDRTTAATPAHPPASEEVEGESGECRIETGVSDANDAMDLIVAIRSILRTRLLPPTRTIRTNRVVKNLDRDS